MCKLFFAVSLFSLLLAGSGFSQEIPAKKLYKFKGVVKDENSAVIAGTKLSFGGNSKTSAITDGDGEFVIELEPGKYEITINKYISSDFVAFIEISENGLNPNNVVFVVKTNTPCCGQTAAKIYPKILSFPKPPFTPAGRAVRATGEVIVLIKIGKDGKVISATVESGHPLLKAVCEKWAKQSLFETSETADEREARLTYVFLHGGKQNLKHYSNPYRTEIVAVLDRIM